MDGWKFQREIDGWASWGQVFQDLEGFSPLALSILASHGFPPEPLQPLTPGTNGVFRSGERVIKLFAPIESGLDTLPERILGRRTGENGPGLLADGGLFILEHPGTVSFHDHPFFVKERKYGNVHFTFFEAPQQEGQSPVPGNDPDRMQEM